MKRFWLFLSDIFSDLSNPQLTARERLAIITDILTILEVVIFNIIPLIIVTKLFDIRLVQLSCLSGHMAGVMFKYAIPLIALFMML